MQVRPEVVSGLRSLFRTGATYSGLLRFLLNQLPQEETDRVTIQRYLMEAFSVPFFAPVRKNVDSLANDDSYASINQWLIPRILAARSVWMENLQSDQIGAWWETQQVTDPDNFPQGKPAWFSDAAWESLTPIEREKVAATSTSCEVLREEGALLARLAEQLQRRVSELESQLSTSRSSIEPHSSSIRPTPLAVGEFERQKTD